MRVWYKKMRKGKALTRVPPTCHTRRQVAELLQEAAQPSPMPVLQQMGFRGRKWRHGSQSASCELCGQGLRLGFLSAGQSKQYQLPELSRG